MTKLTYTKTVRQKTQREVPDYYGYDDTRLGKVVDFLLKGDERQGRKVRDQMYDLEDGEQVEACIHKIECAYESARALAFILGVGGVAASARPKPADGSSLQFLQKRVKHILAQDQGCGGNLNEIEIAEAMAREIIKLAQEITA